jgi:hypothetical protein
MCTACCFIFLPRRTATDISVIDSYPETHFDIVSGQSTMRYDSLDAGANISSKLVVVPKVRRAACMACGKSAKGHSVAARAGALERRANACRV